jgi:hypothetical protein
MAEYDSNMIKPVEGLQNFSRLNPTGRREERKRRQQLQEQNDEKGESSEDKMKETMDEYNEDSDKMTKAAVSGDSQNPNSTGIDFRA